MATLRTALIMAAGFAALVMIFATLAATLPTWMLGV